MNVPVVRWRATTPGSFAPGNTFTGGFALAVFHPKRLRDLFLSKCPKKYLQNPEAIFKLAQQNDPKLMKELEMLPFVEAFAAESMQLEYTQAQVNQIADLVENDTRFNLGS